MVTTKKYILLVLALASAFVLASCTPVNQGSTGTGGGTGVIEPPPPPAEVYVVQLIASSSKARADQIKAQFSGDGYPAVVNTITSTTGLLHRVQIGAYSSEVEALGVLNGMRQRYAGRGNVLVNGAVVKTR